MKIKFSLLLIIGLVWGGCKSQIRCPEECLNGCIVSWTEVENFEIETDGKKVMLLGTICK